MIKVCLFGDPGVGKTSIIDKSLIGSIPETYRPDEGYGASWVYVQEEKLDVWDCAGSMTLDPDEGPWFNDLHVGIIVLDVSKPGLRESLDRWLEPLKVLYPQMPIIICLNKMDLLQSIPIIETDMPIILISAKDDLDLYPLWSLVQELVPKTILLSPLDPTSRHKLQDDQQA